LNSPGLAYKQFSVDCDLLHIHRLYKADIVVWAQKVAPSDLADGGTIGKWRAAWVAMPPNMATAGNRVVSSNQLSAREAMGSPIPSMSHARTLLEPDAVRRTRSLLGLTARDEAQCCDDFWKPDLVGSNQ
jgi:hypothetical protein